MGSLPAESADAFEGTTGSAGWVEVSERLDELKAVLPELADLPEASPTNAGDVLLRMADTTEELRRRVIRDRIQRASLQELMQALLRSPDADAILATLTSYLKQILVADHVLLLRRQGPVAGPAGAVWTAYETGPDGRASQLGRVHFGVDGGRSVPPQDAPGAAVLSIDRTKFAHVLPLAASVDEIDDPEQALGYLCLETMHAVDDEEWNPQELARWVGGMLQTLRHREEMERANGFRRQLLEAMDDGVLAVDAEGRVLEMNIGAQRYLPNVGSELPGLTIDSLSKDAPALVRHLNNALENRTAPPPREIYLRSADRRRVPVNVAVSELRGPDERFQGFVVNLTDLTPVREMEQEIDRLDRLAALGRFAAGVAHEIRNPLAGIGAGVEYIARRFGPNAPEQGDIKYVTGEIKRLNQIVTDLLDHTHRRPLDLQGADARGLLSNTRSALEPLLKERGVRLELVGGDGLIVTADPRRLGQVLLNLVKNAVEATPQGTTVRAQWVAPEGEGPLRFVVTDEGEGMTEEQRRRALEPFFTTKGEGTGLGLYLSHSIIEQHGGRLLFGSNPNGPGTSVIVELPSLGQQEGIERNEVLHPDR